MNAKPTEGPWIADCYDVRVHGGRYIAYCGPHHTPDGEYPAQCNAVDHANARHIAQAVNCHDDLLDVLRMAVARVEIANAEGDNILSAWLPEARAAIAKAEEVQP